MENSADLSKRWTVSRELTNTSNEEIATMMGAVCLDMERNGLNVEYLTVYVDSKVDNYTRIVVLLRLEQYVSNRTVFYWLAHDKAVVTPLRYHAFKRLKRDMRKNRKPCLVKWGLEKQEQPQVPENIDMEW